MLTEALVIGAGLGLSIPLARRVPWFGPVALFLVVSILGVGLLLDLYARNGQGEALYFFAPAAAFFGLGGAVALALKSFPGAKSYAVAAFASACVLGLFALVKLVVFKLGA